MTTITNAGIGSGLNLESIIQVYVNAEQAPQEAILNNKEADTNTELSGIGKLKSALASFQATVKKLADLKSFDQSSVNISGPDTGAFSVTTSNASNGSFQVEVQQLAQGSRLDSTNFASSSTTFGTGGTLSFAVGSNSVDVAVTSTDTLADIRDKINSATGSIGVTANIINSDAGSQLVLSSATTGSANQLTVTSSGDASLADLSTNLTTAQAAQNGQITVNGAVITNSTNTYENAIQGVTITATKQTTGANTLDISRDTGAVTDLVKEFVDGYNSLKDTLNSVGDPKNGELAFDPLVRQLGSQVQGLLGGVVSGQPDSLNNLYQAGVTFSNDGHLEILSYGLGSGPSGEKRLSDAINNNISQLGQLFAGSNGLATTLDGVLTTYTESNGAIDQRQTSLNDTLANISTQRDDLTQRMADLEQTLREKFNGLDQVVAQYKSTGDYLTSALKSLPSVSSSG
ncbi:flagellar filament capping protein FliD [Gallaecimonas kandeliae]|uniref:flagellar filament capping protein FliD n=1 Tax=Gallaecimonas kandeliae TaxID=3029055 RepID=UPI002647A861|nr:flagellar filament capping protein FliD [Gallaecimonas kandeliae]WKE66720.1 flagellar filament capping protein FliD [Gallaecimonas kandeliae]